MTRTEMNTIEDTANDTFDFSNVEWPQADLNGDGAVSIADFNIWNDNRVDADDDEPGLPGVVIYADLNFNEAPTDPTFEGDFIA